MVEPVSPFDSYENHMSMRVRDDTPRAMRHNPLAVAASRLALTEAAPVPSQLEGSHQTLASTANGEVSPPLLSQPGKCQARSCTSLPPLSVQQNTGCLLLAVCHCEVPRELL